MLARTPFSSSDTTRPSYTDAQFQGSFQGPVKVPGLRNRINVFVGYQGTSDHNAQSQASVVPTAHERRAISNSVNAQGLPVTDQGPGHRSPLHRQPDQTGRISPQAAALLAYYPEANADGHYNYQAPILSSSRTDGGNTRLAYSLNNRNQLQGTLGYQRTRGTSTGLFGFQDSSEGWGFDANVNWSLRISQFLNLRSRYQYTRSKNTSLPYFANRTNVSAEAGISGNDQDPLNWGPPGLRFATDLAGLNDGRYSEGRTGVHVVASDLQSFRGRHTLTFTGEFRHLSNNVFSQQDPRGLFEFTGARTGSDFADFLLGLPSTASLAFGNADKFFRSNTYAAGIADDWRVSPSFTMTMALRWDYESPITERFGRLVNLDVAPDFSAIAPVKATDGTALDHGHRSSNIPRPPG